MYLKSFASYRAIRLFGPLFLCSYTLIAISAIPAGGKEFYPFFHWSLFSQAIGFRTDVTLQVKSLNGETLHRPRLLYEMEDSLRAAKTQNGVLIKTIDRFYWAVTEGKPEDVERLREVIENRFLQDAETIEYDLVLIGYDPIERLQTGAIDSMEVVASFAKTSR